MGAGNLLPTSLQLAILHGKVAGKADATVARSLSISERTLRRELDDLASILGVAGRAGLFVEAGRRGWLDRVQDQ